MSALRMRWFKKTSVLLLMGCVSIFSAVSSYANGASVSSGLGFEPNVGQLKDAKGKKNTALLYRARTSGASIYFQKDKISYVFEQFEKENRRVKSVRQHRVDMVLQNANPNARVAVQNPKNVAYNYYCGKDHAQFNQYEKVVYHNIYPAIDLVYYSTQEGKLKYDFVVHPGGDPAQIQLALEGADRLNLNSDGAFQVQTSLGNWEEETPYIYQANGKSQVTVNGRFQLKGNILNFNVGNYDRTKDLVIDPTLNFSTHFGGTDLEYIYSVANNAAGEAYVVGETYSASFPASVGPGFDSSLDGFVDAFAAKFTAAGGLVWATFIGGNDDESGNAVALAPNGNVYITGFTTSNNFPVTTGAYQTSLRGGSNSDAYLLQMTPAGTITWATYYGGTGSENFDSFFPGAGVTVDPNGNVVIIGLTSSTDLLVGTPTGFQTTYGGNPIDGFIAKFTSTGSKVWESYYGGNARDRVTGVISDQNGNLFITGGTGSTSGFPTQNPGGGAYFQAAKSTGTDAFIAKISENCQLLWSTYYGGTGEDNNLYWHAIDIDHSGNVYMSGSTSSNNLPLATGTNGGSTDGFIAKFSNSGAHQWSRYHGGNSGDDGHGLAVTPDGSVVMVGFSLSTTGFPIVSTPQFPENITTFGINDAYIAKYNSTGTCVWSTYVGGDDYDENFDVSVRHNGDIYVGGATSSTDFPTLNALQPINDGFQKGILMRFTDATTPPCVSTALTVTPTITDACGGTANGSILLNVLGARPGMSYSWSNGATTQDLRNILPGTYTVTITAEGGTGSCVFTQNYTIVDVGACPVPACNPEFAVNTSVTNPNGLCGGTAPVTLTGSVPTILCSDYDVEVITPAPAPLTGTATSLTLGDDQLSAAIPIGFTFKHLCNNYSQLFVSSNGFIAFTNPGGSFFTNTTIPNAATPNDIIAFIWDDLNPALGGTINHFVTGTPGARKFVLTFTNIQYFNGGGNSVTVQVVLNETTNIIEINNINIQASPGGATQGIENAAGTIGYVAQGRNNTIFTVSNELVRFKPKIAPVGPVTFQWFNGTATAGPAGATVNVTPTESTTYTLVATDEGQGCAVTRTATVSVPGIRVDNVTHETCAGNNGAISTTVTILGACQTAPIGCLGTSNAPVTVGTGTGNETIATPFRATTFTDVRYQALYLASELVSAGLKPGKITNLSFDISGKTSTAGQFFQNFTIKIGCTNATSLSAGNYIAGTQTVFTAPAPGYATVSGINNIALTSGYVWDGTSNLIVEFCYDNTTAVGTDGIRVTNTGYVSSIYDRETTGSGCTFTTAINAFALRPNLGFTTCSTSILWTPGGQTTDDITGLNGGTYTLTVNDYNNCTFTREVVINEATPAVNLASALPTDICAGETTVLTFNLQGTAPWTLGYQQTGSPVVTVSGITATPFVVTVTPTGVGNITYTPVSIDHSIACPAGPITGSATVSVKQFATANTPTTTMTICQGQTVDIPVTLTGTSPWTLDYTTQEAGGPLIANTINLITSNNITIPFTPANIGSYTLTLTDVSDLVGCGNGVATGTVVINVVQGPAAFIGGTPPPVCQGQGAIVAVFLTGTSPWTFQLSENGGPGVTYGPIFGSSSFELITLTVSPTQSGTVTYTVSSVTDASGCANGPTFGEVTVEVTPLPTAMIGGTHPAICEGNGAAFALLLTGAAPWSIKVSENGGAPVTINNITSTLSLVPITPTGTGPRTLTLVEVMDANGCPGGMVSGQGTVTVNAKPTATLLPTTGTICQGDGLNQTINLTGAAPWTIKYQVNGGPLNTVSGINASPFVLSTTPALTGNLTYTLFEVMDASGCGGGMVSGSNVITVKAKPMATIGGTTTTICQGQTATFVVSLTGTAPWTIAYSQNGAPAVTVSNITNALHTITVTPSVTGMVTYTLASVSDASGCTAVAPSGNFTVNVLAKPTAMMSGAAPSICPGFTTTFMIELTGTGPWNIKYQESGGVNGQYNGIVSSPFFLTVTPSSTGPKTFTLTEVMDMNGCTGGAVSGQGTVTVKEPPTATISGTSPTICLGQPTTFTVNFTGLAPWNITYSENSTTPILVSGITTNPYTLTVTPTQAGLRNYILTTVTDDGACLGGFASGNVSVNVNPISNASATISGTPEPICEGSATSFMVTFAGGTPPYSFSYTENGSAPVTVSNITTATYTLNVVPGGTGLRVYTLTGMSQSNPCATTSVSGTASVTVNPNFINTATLSGSASPICLGSSVAFTVNIGGGTPPWSLQYSENNGTPITINNITASPYTLVVTPTGTGVRTFSLVSLSANTPCTQNFVNGSATVAVNPSLAASATMSGPVQTICLGQTANLVVSLTGTAPWTITYTENDANPVTITGIMSSPLILTVTPQSIGVRTYKVTNVSDALGCGTPSTTGSLSVVVQSNSTAIASISGNPSICAGQFTTINFNLGGTPPWSVGYSANGSAPITITGIQTSPFQLTVSPTQSTTYTLTSVIDGSSCPGAGSGTVGGAATVTVTSGSSAIIGGSPNSVCLGQPVQFSVNLTGTSPWTVQYSENGGPAVTVSGLTGTPAALIVTPTGTGVRSFSLISVTDGSSCGTGSVAGVGIVNVGSQLNLSLVSKTDIGCAGGLGNFTVSASGGTGSGYTYSIDGINFNNTTGVFSGVQAGNYLITAKDNGGCQTTLLVSIVQPAVPTITSISAITHNSATINWTTVPGAAGYILGFRVVGSSAYNFVSVSAPPFVLTNLQSSTNYDIVIRTRCSNGSTSALSSPSFFTTLANPNNTTGCITPTNLSVVVTGPTTATVTWSASPEGVCYIVSYGPINTNPSLWPQFLIPHPGNVLQVTGLIPGNQYGVNVRTNCSLCSVRSGVRTNASQTVSFTTPNGAREGNNLTEANHATNIRVYPNPNRGNFTLSYEHTLTTVEQVKLKVTDLTGRTVIEQNRMAVPGENDFNFDLQNAAAGVYILHLDTAGLQRTVKVIVQ